MRLYFAGDYCTATAAEKPANLDFAELLGRQLPEVIAGCDLALVNIEAPLTRSGQPTIKTGPNLKMDPDWLEPLAWAGFSVATLANNHIYDYGERGLTDTIEACRSSGLTAIGAGSHLAEARRVGYFDVNGGRVGIVNVSCNEWSVARCGHGGAAPLDAIENVRAIRAAKERTDAVVVVAHAGNELSSYPPPGLVNLYRFFVESGASAVVGHHPHCLQGYEVHHGSPIVYSLGNFFFPPSHKEPECWYEGVAVELNLPFTGEQDLTLHPYTQCRGHPGIRWAQGDERERFLEHMQHLSGPLHDPDELETRWKASLQGQADVLLWYLSFGSKTMQVVRQILARFGLLRPVCRRDRRVDRLRLHLLRSQSFRELLVSTLEESCEKQR